MLVAVDDGTDTMIVRVSDGGTNGIAAAELSLLAILEGVADATTQQKTLHLHKCNQYRV